MKLTKLKGIAHDLANHLEFQIWFDKYRNIAEKVSTDVTNRKDRFDNTCLKFFNERLPKSFDINRIKMLKIDIQRSMTTLNIKIKVKVDDKEFSYSKKSMMA